MVVLVAFMIFLTEFTSNSASATLMIPLVYEAVKSIDVSSVNFLIPLTLAASFAFMLPVATPPNTLVFGTEKIAIKDMVKVGIWLNLIGILVITEPGISELNIYYLFPIIFCLGLSYVAITIRQLSTSEPV